MAAATLAGGLSAVLVRLGIRARIELAGCDF
jgi:hypothetical protein